MVKSEYKDSEETNPTSNLTQDQLAEVHAPGQESTKRFRENNPRYNFTQDQLTEVQASGQEWIERLNKKSKIQLYSRATD